MFFSAVQVLYTEAQTVRTRKDFGVTFFSTSPDCFADYWDAWSKTPRAIQGQSSSTWDCSRQSCWGPGLGHPLQPVEQQLNPHLPQAKEAPGSCPVHLDWWSSEALQILPTPGCLCRHITSIQIPRDISETPTQPSEEVKTLTKAAMVRLQCSSGTPDLCWPYPAQLKQLGVPRHPPGNGDHYFVQFTIVLLGLLFDKYVISSWSSY